MNEYACSGGYTNLKQNPETFNKNTKKAQVLRRICAPRVHILLLKIIHT